MQSFSPSGPFSKASQTSSLMDAVKGVLSNKDKKTIKLPETITEEDILSVAMELRENAKTWEDMKRMINKYLMEHAKQNGQQLTAANATAFEREVLRAHNHKEVFNKLVESVQSKQEKLSEGYGMMRRGGAEAEMFDPAGRPSGFPFGTPMFPEQIPDNVSPFDSDMDGDGIPDMIDPQPINPNVPVHGGLPGSPVYNPPTLTPPMAPSGRPPQPRPELPFGVDPDAPLRMPVPPGPNPMNPAVQPGSVPGGPMVQPDGGPVFNPSPSFRPREEEMNAMVDAMDDESMLAMIDKMFNQLKQQKGM